MDSMRPDGVTIPDLVARAVTDGVLPPDDLLATLLAPYFAGIDTVASSLSFACYAAAMHPNARALIREELDANDGPLTVDALRGMPWLRAFVLETQRCYPVTTVSMRHCTAPLEFSRLQHSRWDAVCVRPPVDHAAPRVLPGPRPLRHLSIRGWQVDGRCGGVPAVWNGAARSVSAPGWLTSKCSPSSPRCFATTMSSSSPWTRRCASPSIRSPRPRAFASALFGARRSAEGKRERRPGGDRAPFVDRRRAFSVATFTTTPSPDPAMP